MNPTGDSRARLGWRLLIWQLLALSIAGTVGVVVVASPGIESPILGVLGSLALVAAWVLAFRFLMIDTAVRRLWYVVAVIALVMAGTLGVAGMVGALFLSLVIHTFRQYMTWRHISSRRRALGFGMGILAVVLVLLGGQVWKQLPDEGFTGHIRNLGGWALGSLLMFWLASEFRLAVRMRLHFLRLRPKLAVSGFLIGLVPLLLFFVLAVTAFYTGLGGSRAKRTIDTLESWRSLASTGVELGPAVLDTTFAWPDSASVAGSLDAGMVMVSPPAWTPQLARTLTELAAAEADTQADAWGAVRDTTGWFRADHQIWLLRWQGLQSDAPHVRGWRLGQRAMEHLSDLMNAEVHIRGSGLAEADSTFIVASEDGASLPFGGGLLAVIDSEDSRLDQDDAFVALRVTWTGLKDEFLGGDNNLNVALVIGLIVLAVMLLLIEAFALYFGIRISEGIVGGVHAIHRGTRALASGDLDTVIDIPNEDEFGDVAKSFNEMTRAVKKGRKDALARERLTRELETARQIQERLLPHESPELQGFEVTGTSIPSREVGGDYFDFLLQNDHKIGVAIGDVSGKGMPAALLMSNLQASLHGQVIHPSSVAEIVGRVNDLIVKSTDPHMFATFFYGLVDMQAGTLTCTNAGHNPPILLTADGGIQELNEGGMILGMLPDQEYQQQTVELAPGDVVVLYTDGITEAVGPSAEEYDPEAMLGEEALFEVVRRSRHLPAAGIKDAILAAVRDHTSGVAQSDDITLVVVRRQG